VTLPCRIGRLYVIVNTVVGNPFDETIDTARLVQLAISGGAGTIQIRGKNEEDGVFVETVTQAVAICRGSGIPLIVNDRLDIAIDGGADGVHLGQADTSIAEARRAGSEHLIVGATAGSLEEAGDAEASGADYIGFGHLFPTTSKSKPLPPVGIDALAEVCAAVKIPVVAIGGIDAANIDSVLRAGAHGVAVIGAIAGAEDPAGATRMLRTRIEDFLRE